MLGIIIIAAIAVAIFLGARTNNKKYFSGGA